MASTIKLIGDFLRATEGSEFLGNSSTATSAMANLDPIKSPTGPSQAADEFLAVGMEAQNQVLRRRPNYEIGIWYDIDQELAPLHFAIDYALFGRIS